MTVETRSISTGQVRVKNVNLVIVKNAVKTVRTVKTVSLLTPLPMNEKRQKEPILKFKKGKIKVKGRYKLRQYYAEKLNRPKLTCNEAMDCLREDCMPIFLT